MSLYNGESIWSRIELTNASVMYNRQFMSTAEANILFEQLLPGPWRQDTITFYGKTHNIPRLQQWYGNEGMIYNWSGIEMIPLSWTEPLITLRNNIQDITKESFNSVLLNYYRNGQDTVSWHADDEYGLGQTPYIASVSLGVERDFVLRRNDNHSKKTKLTLHNGSLLLMAGQTQQHYQHSLPRRPKCNASRINLTFRQFNV